MHRTAHVRNVVFWAYVATLAVLMLAPMPARPAALPRYTDKLVHVVLFAGFAWLLFWRVQSTTRPHVARVVLVSAMVAAVIELLQLPIPYRSTEFLDFVAGTGGAVLGAVLARVTIGSARPGRPDEVAATGRRAP